MKAMFRSSMASFMGAALAYAGRLSTPQLMGRPPEQNVAPPSVSEPRRLRSASGTATVILERDTGRYHIHRFPQRGGGFREKPIPLLRGMDRATVKALNSVRYRRAGGMKGR